MKLEMADQYNYSDGAWYLTSANYGPIEVVVKVEAKQEKAKKVAQLLEAAPDLLEALQDILGENDLHENSNGEFVCFWCGREMEQLQQFCISDNCAGYKAREAIKKAEG